MIQRHPALRVTRRLLTSLLSGLFILMSAFGGAAIGYTLFWRQ